MSGLQGSTGHVRGYAGPPYVLSHALVIRYAGSACMDYMTALHLWVCMHGCMQGKLQQTACC